MRLDLFKVRLFTNRELRSLGKKAVPEDFKSLKRDEVSSFENKVEKFDKGDEFVISVLSRLEFNHLLFKKFFLFHLLLSTDFRGFVP